MTVLYFFCVVKFKENVYRIDRKLKMVLFNMGLRFLLHFHHFGKHFIFPPLYLSLFLREGWKKRERQYNHYNVSLLPHLPCMLTLFPVFLA